MRVIVVVNIVQVWLAVAQQEWDGGCRSAAGGNCSRMVKYSGEDVAELWYGGGGVGPGHG